ncbi:MAG: ornithine cyclodeaminase, partial [Rubrivivax sp.]
MTTLLTTQDIARLVQRVGLPDLLRRLVGYLETDYGRWAEFDKTPRVAAHSA